MVYGLDDMGLPNGKNNRRTGSRIGEGSVHSSRRESLLLKLMRRWNRCFTSLIADIQNSTELSDTKVEMDTDEERPKTRHSPPYIHQNIDM